MSDDRVSATRLVAAPSESVFGILVDPRQHAAIDGTGWVVESLEDRPLTEAGQVFRVAMYHPNHPDGNYEVANEVLVLDRPNAVSWRPGYDSGSGRLEFGG